jgi:hypothetical protein
VPQILLECFRSCNKFLISNLLFTFSVKDKVDVLLEVERLKTGREELLSEVQSLHAQLEQERSKVHDMAKMSDKQQKNKACSLDSLVLIFI